MTGRGHSLTAQASAVRAVIRLDCIKPLRARASEETLLLDQLRVAAETLERLAREQASGKPFFCAAAGVVSGLSADVRFVA